MALKIKSRGMTLLEILVAISIFSLIGLAAYRVLSSITGAERQSSVHSAMLQRWQRAMLLIDADLQQPVQRPVRRDDGGEEPALMVNQGDYVLAMTRGGWLNPMRLPRSHLLRVAYGLGPHPLRDVKGSPFFGDNRTYLLRHYWTALDRTAAGDSNEVIQALLPDVESLRVTVYDSAGAHTRWPDTTANGEQGAVTAIELAFSHKQLGDIRRLYSTY